MSSRPEGDELPIKEILYKCACCGYVTTKEELERVKMGVKCPKCHCKILYKIRTSGRTYFKAI